MASPIVPMHSAFIIFVYIHAWFAVHVTMNSLAITCSSYVKSVIHFSPALCVCELFIISAWEFFFTLCMRT